MYHEGLKEKKETVLGSLEKTTFWEYIVNGGEHYGTLYSRMSNALDF